MESLSTELIPQPEIDLQLEIDLLLKQELSPENFTEYANSALDQIITISERAQTDYGKAPTIGFTTSGDVEDAAFSYHGVTSINETLNHVAGIASDIDRVKSFIQNLPEATKNILDSNGSTRLHNRGNGTYTEPAMTDRVATVLFVLEQDYCIPLNENHVTPGTIVGARMRKAAYYAIEAPELNRTVFVCDEKANATFVFDTQKLEKLGLSMSDIFDFDKDAITALIKDSPLVAKRMIDRGDYVRDLRGLLENPINGSVAYQKKPDPNHYLRPKPPERSLTLKGISKALGKSQGLIKNAYEEHQELIGEGGWFYVGGDERRFLDVKAQEAIKNILTEAGYFKPKAPEGRETFKEKTKDWPVSEKRLEQRYKDLVAEGILIDVEEYIDPYGKIKRYPSDEHVAILKDYLTDGKGFVPKALEKELSDEEIANLLIVSAATVKKSITEIGDKYGDREDRRFGPETAKASSFAQLGILARHMEEKGRLQPFQQVDELSIAEASKRLELTDAGLIGIVKRMRQEGLLGIEQLRRPSGTRGRTYQVLSEQDIDRVTNYHKG